MRRPPVRERLLSKTVINFETGCWEWSGTKDKYGYGKIKVEGRQRKAHRVTYELIEGMVPEGLQLDHLCRNRGCINPAHLEPVTPRENTLRGESPSAACARKTHCPAGHAYTQVSRGFRVCGECKRRAGAAARLRVKEIGS